MGKVVASGATSDDMHQGQEYSIPLLVTECKQAPGEGDCGPLTSIMHCLGALEEPKYKYSQPLNAVI